MGATHMHPEVNSLRVVLLTGSISVDCFTCQLSNKVTGLVYGLLLYFRVHHYELFYCPTIRHNDRSNVRAVVLLIESLWAVLLPDYRT